MFQRSFLTAFTILFFAAGCKKSDSITTPTPPIETKGVFVLNEGNFQRPNSTLSFYIPDSNETYPDVLGILGDTGNDIVLFGTKGFIVVNNSNKVIVFSTENDSILGTIQLPNKSPRQIAVVSDTKAYVTNGNDNSVSVVNPTTFAITKDIIVGNNPEGIIAIGGKIYVCNYGFGSDSTVSVINGATDAVTTAIVVGKGPSSIGVDGDGDIFVQCSGYSDFKNPANDTPGSVAVIDPSSNTVAASIPFPLATYGHPSEITVSKNGYAYVSTSNGITKLDTKTNSITQSQFISSFSVYSIAVDDATDNLYIADPKDYTQNGEVKIYDKNGSAIGSFGVGIIPGDFAFKR